MGMGISFTFIGVVLVAIPAVWLAWWALDSLGNRPVQAAPAPAPPRPEPKPSSFDHPQPADLQLPGSRGRITVYALGETAPKSVCKGPDALGRCPLVKAGGTVPCAGCVLVLPVAVRGSRDWHIPSGYTSCVAGSYGALRQPQTA
jgi:hypothetical protein